MRLFWVLFVIMAFMTGVAQVALLWMGAVFALLATVPTILG